MDLRETQQGKMPSSSKTIATSSVAAFTPPYPPSWFDRLLTWMDELPGPTWIYLVALLIIPFAYLQAVLWWNGALPFPTIDLTRAFFIPLTPYVLGFWLYIRRVARNQLAKFRPALRVTDAEYAELEYTLMYMPARATLVFTLVAIVGNVIFYSLLPQEYVSLYGADLFSVLSQLIWIQFPALLLAAVGVFRAVYILRQVNRVHRRAPQINLYQAPSLYAFSSLTAQIAIGLIAPVYYLFVTQQTLVMTNPPLFGAMVFAIVTAVACFILPLREMHNRIVVEKLRLLTEAYTRFENLVTRVHQAVDANELQQMDNWHKALSNLVIERDALEKIPTWPWERGTLTGFLTALILPIVLWLVTRILDRLF
ncbi:MAG: hypothetical protein EYC68_22360 [Chloroflexota bacterium]|nr:MAG: hypothetical protein EYC68_22360 [Chloroflexota bacterium]